jgi:hypothetical protein
MNLVKQLPCLAPEICDKLVDKVQELSFNRSLIYSETGELIPDKIRTSTSTCIPESFNEILSSALNATFTNWSTQVSLECPDYSKCLKLPGVTANLQTIMETIGLLRYEQGQEYFWHADQHFTSKLKLNPYTTDTRQWSFVVYLNDDFEGGQTRVLDEIFQPKKGTALVFPSSWHYPHTAMPVKRGIKYAAVTWYHPKFT